MAFKLSPTHNKKDPFATFRKKGWIGSPVKQGDDDTQLQKLEVEAEEEAEEDITKSDWNLVDQFYDETTGETVINESREGKGDAYHVGEEKMSSEDWAKFLKTDKGKEYLDRNKEETRQRRIPGGGPEVNEKDYEVKNLATMLGEAGLAKFYNNKYYDSASEKMVNHTPESFMKEYGHDERFTDVFHAYRDAHKVGEDADQSIYDDVNQGSNVEKGTESKEDNPNADEENALGKTIYDAPVEQSSPVRQLMNKYMPNKSMAKQEKIYKTDTAKMVKDYGALPSSSSKSLGIESFAASGSTLPEIVIDSNKNKKSITKQEKKKPKTYKFKDEEAGIKSKSKVNRRFGKGDKHKISI